jgi:hypothetical protein
MLCCRVGEGCSCAHSMQLEAPWQLPKLDNTCDHCACNDTKSQTKYAMPQALTESDSGTEAMRMLHVVSVAFAATREPTRFGAAWA